MAIEIDLTQFESAANKKTRTHDNCTVLDLDPESVGSSVYPRMIEVRPGGDDGPRVLARWDGGLDLAVNDIVICKEFGQNPIWVVDAIGGDDSGAGRVRVSKVWESDFGAVALTADATGQIGIGTATPDEALEVTTASGAAKILISSAASNPTLKFLNSTANTKFELLYATSPDQMRFINDSGSTLLAFDQTGEVGMGTTSPVARLDVRQTSATGAIPTIRLTQADVSEEMIEFNSTIGTGNAIEASGLKLLTTTHFVKVTLPGSLTRYMPVGTIDTVGPIIYKSANVTTQGLGANPDIFAFGFYEWSATDANLTQASTTQTFGTANVAYAAHAFVVTSGAGTVNTGVVGLRVTGTSINDQGTRTTSDNEWLLADITAAATDGFYETSKKWLGQVTFELFIASGSPTTYSLDFNYGLNKYDDWGNNDFTITDIEAVGFAGANDNNLDIKLLHMRSTGWTYAATGFTPVTAANTITSLVGDHSTDDQISSGEHFAWKRDNLSTAIAGSSSEGFLVFVSSSANNAIEYLNIHVGVVF